jgi:type I restriction enzyme S subunit
MGPFGSNIKTDNFVEQGVPVIRGTNLSGGRFNSQGLVFISKEKADELKSSNAFPGDLVFTHRGTLGQVGIIPKGPYPRYVVSQSQMKLSCDPSKALPDFMFYYFSSVGKTDLLKHMSGSGVPALASPLTTLKNLRIVIPPLHGQQKIASILSAYDDLIENNNRRIKVLEEMAQNIYREWFVNFCFAGHEKVKIVDSEFGPKPEGWEVTRLGNLLRKLARKPRLKKEQYLEDGRVPAIDQGSAFVGGYTNAAEFTQDDPLPIIVFGDHTRVVKYIDFPFASGADGTQLLYPRDEDLMPAYFYYLVKNIDLSDYAYARHFKFLKDQVVLVPNRSVLREFNETVESMLKLMSLIRSKNDILRRIRDLLLPKLISGEIAVENLDIVAEGLE